VQTKAFRSVILDCSPPPFRRSSPKTAVRSWSSHTRVNAKHEPRSTNPAVRHFRKSPPRPRTHAQNAIFPSLPVALPLLLVRTQKWHPRNRSPTTSTCSHPKTPRGVSHSPSISLSLLSTLLLLAPLRGKPHRPARVAPLLSAGPPKNNFNGPLVTTHSLEILFRTQHKAVEP
jgi:hypothetical protein